jgi:hypothetical protein
VPSGQLAPNSDSILINLRLAAFPLLANQR